jgi:hypothetical protein
MPIDDEPSDAVVASNILNRIYQTLQTHYDTKSWPFVALCGGDMFFDRVEVRPTKGGPVFEVTVAARPLDEPAPVTRRRFYRVAVMEVTPDTEEARR